MTQISSRNRLGQTKQVQGGFTLVELLTALALLSLMAGLSASMLQRALPQISVDSARSTLENDLRRARLAARTQGTVITLTPSPQGYAIEALDLTRRLDKGTVLIWPEDAPAFYPTGAAIGGTITITKRHATRQVKVDPYTAKITSQ